MHCVPVKAASIYLGIDTSVVSRRLNIPVPLGLSRLVLQFLLTHFGTKYCISTCGSPLSAKKLSNKPKSCNFSTYYNLAKF